MLSNVFKVIKVIKKIDVFRVKNFIQICSDSNSGLYEARRIGRLDVFPTFPCMLGLTENYICYMNYHHNISAKDLDTAGSLASYTQKYGELPSRNKLIVVIFRTENPFDDATAFTDKVELLKENNNK